MQKQRYKAKNKNDLRKVQFRKNMAEVASDHLHVKLSVLFIFLSCFPCKRAWNGRPGKKAEHGDTNAKKQRR